MTTAEARRFGLTVGIAFLLVAALSARRGYTPTAWATGGLGALLVLTGLAAPALLGPVHAAWMGLATAMSRVTTPLVMTVVYLGILTPFGVIRRMMVGSSVRRRIVGDSYWIARGERRRSNLDRQF